MHYLLASICHALSNIVPVPPMFAKFYHVMVSQLLLANPIELVWFSPFQSEMFLFSEASDLTMGDY